MAIHLKGTVPSETYQRALACVEQVLRLRGGMQIKVKTLTGKEIEFDIEPTVNWPPTNQQAKPAKNTYQSAQLF
jgi:hypothetical protein